MTKQPAKIVLLFLIFGLVNLSMVGCSGSLSQPAPAAGMTATPLQEEPQPTQTRIAVTPTPTSTATPTATATYPPEPTPPAMTVIKAENGWVTYRNEIVGYEISAPTSYQVKGVLPEVWWNGHDLLGPAVPDEEINRLLSKYYGGSLWIEISDTGANGQPGPWPIHIIAHDILVNDLGGWVGQPGGADYQYTSRQETLNIDWQSYPLRITVESRDNQPVGEYSVLYLEQDGIELIFGYFPPRDDPEAYQKYLKVSWPEIRKIIETYRKLPEPTSLNGPPSVSAAGLTDPSPEAVARALFEQYLTGFQEAPLDPLMKLSSFRIDEVEIPAKWQPCAELNRAEFVAAVTYSVEPENWQLEKWAEDGYSTFDHWVRRKSAAIAVFRSGQEYTMQILANPICPGY